MQVKRFFAYGLRVLCVFCELWFCVLWISNSENDIVVKDVTGQTVCPSLVRCPTPVYLPAPAEWAIDTITVSSYIYTVWGFSGTALLLTNQSDLPSSQDLLDIPAVVCLYPLPLLQTLLSIQYLIESRSWVTLCVGHHCWMAAPWAMHGPVQHWATCHTAHQKLIPTQSSFTFNCDYRVGRNNHIC